MTRIVATFGGGSRAHWQSSPHSICVSTFLFLPSFLSVGRSCPVPQMPGTAGKTSITGRSTVQTTVEGSGRRDIPYSTRLRHIRFSASSTLQTGELRVQLANLRTSLLHLSVLYFLLQYSSSHYTKNSTCTVLHYTVLLVILV